jgi:hypothetical protein
MVKVKKRELHTLIENVDIVPEINDNKKTAVSDNETF